MARVVSEIVQFSQGSSPVIFSPFYYTHQSKNWRRAGGGEADWVPLTAIDYIISHLAPG